MTILVEPARRRNSGSSLSPVIKITTRAGDDIDWSGFSSMRIRLQLGSADELELELMAQNQDGSWRPDMPIWQVGGTLSVSAGYDGDLSLIQSFEIVSTTNSYGGGEDVPSMTVRAASELARAARNRNPRAYAGKTDYEVLDEICREYGWANEVYSDRITDRIIDLKSKFTKSGRVKAQGTTDLELLRLIASDAQLGGPRLSRFGQLIMPEPSADDPLVFVRGAVSGRVIDALLEDSYALLSFSPSREGGSDNVQLSIVAWDPEAKSFVEKVFQADEFGGDPRVVHSGTLSSASIGGESSTRGLTLQVIVARGWNADERRDVLATGRYINETDAVALAQRWFSLREKLGRWATIEVDGNAELRPYSAILVDGEMAEMDRGYWLPTVVEHNWGDGGWTSRLTCIRVVEDSTVTEAS